MLSATFYKPGPRLLNALAVSALLLLPFLVYAHALGGAWIVDDPIVLYCALEYSPWQYFFLPEAAQCISKMHFTPWVIFSFRLDAWLFGLWPAAFQAHNLLSLGLAGGLTFMFLRLWLNAGWALGGASLFLIGAPVWFIAQATCLRHYSEGLIFSILALHLFILAVRQSRHAYAWLGGFFYLLAVTAKEIYVPLSGLLLFIPEGRFKPRLIYALPYGLVAAAYLPWRWHMLGQLIEPQRYPRVLPASWLDAWSVLAGIPQTFFLSLGAATGLFAALLSGLVIFLAIRRQLAWPLLAALLGVLSLPLLPLFGNLQNDQNIRLVFFAWWAAAGGLAFVCQALGQRFAGIALMALFSLAVILKHQQFHEKYYPLAQTIRAASDFLWTRGTGQTLLLAGIDTYARNAILVTHEFMGTLKAGLGQGGMPSVAVSASPAQAHTWIYYPECACIHAYPEKR
jgi:hypothetical protein